jgi:hypothetical protein
MPVAALSLTPLVSQSVRQSGVDGLPLMTGAFGANRMPTGIAQFFQFFCRAA